MILKSQSHWWIVGAYGSTRWGDCPCLGGRCFWPPFWNECWIKIGAKYFKPLGQFPANKKCKDPQDISFLRRGMQSSPLVVMSSKKPGHTTCRPANLTVYEIYVAFRLAVSPYIFIKRSNPSWPKQEIRAEKLCAEKVAGIKICTEQEDESWQVIGVEVQSFRLDEGFCNLFSWSFVPLSYPTGVLGWTPSPWYLPQFQLTSQVAGHVPKVLKRLQNQQALTQAQRSIAGEEMQKAWLTVFFSGLGVVFGCGSLDGFGGFIVTAGPICWNLMRRSVRMQI